MTRDEQRRFRRRRKDRLRYEWSARYRAMVRAEDVRDGVMHFFMRGELPQVDGGAWPSHQRNIISIDLADV